MLIEQCPFKNTEIILKTFTSEGGDMVIKEYGVRVNVPKGAIDSDDIEIYTAASLFEPFMIPKYCRLVSPYVWIAADYVFKKRIQN